MKVFISYRRDDSAPYAGRIHDRLEDNFDFFMDVDAIPLGQDFREIIEREVSECEVLLALIGKNWLGDDGEGNHRIVSHRDFVRVEIAAALKNGIPVIPVLLDGAHLPSEHLLPDDLHQLLYRNGIEVRHASFPADIEKLRRGVEGYRKTARSKRSWFRGLVEPSIPAPRHKVAEEPPMKTEPAPLPIASPPPLPPNGAEPSGQASMAYQGPEDDQLFATQDQPDRPLLRRTLVAAGLVGGGLAVGAFYLWIDRDNGPTVAVVRAPSLPASVVEPTKPKPERNSVKSVSTSVIGPDDRLVATDEKDDIKTAAKDTNAPIGYVAVLSTKRSRIDALTSFAELQEKYTSVLSNSVPHVRRADLTSRGLGVMYRAVIGPLGSREAAGQVCIRLRNAGYAGCWVAPY